MQLTDTYTFKMRRGYSTNRWHHMYTQQTHINHHTTLLQHTRQHVQLQRLAHPLVTCLGPSLNTLWITKQAFQHTTDTCLRGNLATTRHTVLALFSRQVAMTTSSLWSRKEVYRRRMHLTTKESMGPHILTRHRSLGEHMATCTASVQEHTEGPIYWPLPISWYTTCVLCGYHTETYGVFKQYGKFQTQCSFQCIVKDQLHALS